jgi:beta-glucanase (GH16 family)
MYSVIRSLTLAAFIGSLAGFVNAETVIFQEDFNASTLDATKWGVGNNTIGRTQLGNTPALTNQNGLTYATLRFDTYNAAYPGQYFKGSEIFTKQSFGLNQVLIFEARVRCRKVASGQVCSMFTYFYQDPLTDEIDFEFLTKQPANSVLTTTWNDWDYRLDNYVNPVFYNSQQVTGNFNRADWNILEMVWTPGSIEWYVNGNFVRASETAVPTSPMNLRLNFWAPASGWTAAYNAALKPASAKNKNVQYFYDVDYVKVKQP